MPEPSPQGFAHDYLAYLLARASLQISTSFHAQVRAAGLTVMEWRVLASLSDGPPLSIKALADIILAQQPTVTKLVGRMAQQGWVTRSSSRADKRQTLVSLTDKGQAAAAPLLVLAKAHEQDVLATLGVDDEVRLKSQLRALIHQSASDRN